MMLKWPVGISAFDELIEEAYTWVDKSLFIRDVLLDSAKALLITRPRRFGKTLNLSMLYHFLSNHPDLVGKERFRGLAIESAGPEILAHQGQHPVIMVSLKDLRGESMDVFEAKLQEWVRDLYRQFAYLEDSEALHPDDQKYFATLSSTCPPKEWCMDALHRLMHMLHQYWKKRVWLLIDEFDAPVHAAYEAGYYDELMAFLRVFLCPAIKDNRFLAKAVMTGIFRVAKESLFSGMNNLEVYSLLSDDYAGHFGFSEAEVEVLLQQSGLGDQAEAVQAWYNGYRVGHATVYNPWSIVKCIKHRGKRIPYWVNTNDNALVKRLLSQRHEVKLRLEQLLHGEAISVNLSEHTVFPDLENDVDMVWHLLYFSGYLTSLKSKWSGLSVTCELVIPNFEVRQLIESIVETWLTKALPETLCEQTVSGILNGQAEAIQVGLQALVRDAMSYWDAGGAQPEQIYHAFVLGLLVHLQPDYLVRSNRESGYGRFDVMLFPKGQQAGIVLEFKRCRPGESLLGAAEDALSQIQSRDYLAELRAHGAQCMHAIGIAFRGKEVDVKTQTTLES